jgi:hypothetical protein
MALPKYLSKEWLAQVMEKSKTDQDYLSKVKGFDAHIRQVATDYPGNVDVLMTYELKDGYVKATRDEKPAPSQWRQLKNDDPFLSTAISPYEVMVKMHKGELDARTAYDKKMLTFHASMLKVAAKASKLNAWNAMVSSVKCEY